MAVVTPYLLAMLPVALRTNKQNVVRNVIGSLFGYAIFELGAIALRDHYYWPIVVEVYSEAK